MGKPVGRDRCGCAMGAKFMAVGLLIALSYYGKQYIDNELSVLSLLLKVFIIAFFAAGMGKIFGILVYRYKARQHS